MNKLQVSLLSVALLAVGTPAFAADLSVPAAAPKAESPLAGVTLSLETAPEFGQRNDTAGNNVNDLVDSYYTAGISYKLNSDFNIGATIKDQAKPNGDHQEFLQGTVGTGFDLTDAVSIKLQAGLGMTWGATGYTIDGDANSNFFYYLASVGADVKLNSQWTWNAINVQYKNAFNVDYVTPSASTGITYTINKQNAVYAKATYNWSDNAGATSVDPSKASVALGYKYSF